MSGCQPVSTKSYTNKYQHHTDCSYGYKTVCCYDDTYSKPVKIYRGEDSTEKFMQEMLKEIEYCRNIISTKFNVPLVMSDDEESRAFQAAKVCHICEQLFCINDVGKLNLFL